MDLEQIKEMIKNESPSELMLSIIATALALYQLEKKEHNRSNYMLLVLSLAQFIFFIIFLFRD